MPHPMSTQQQTATTAVQPRKLRFGAILSHLQALQTSRMRPQPFGRITPHAAPDGASKHRSLSQSLSLSPFRLLSLSMGPSKRRSTHMHASTHAGAKTGTLNGYTGENGSTALTWGSLPVCLVPGAATSSSANYTNTTRHTSHTHTHTHLVERHGLVALVVLWVVLLHASIGQVRKLVSADIAANTTGSAVL
jgi:hypothetical protein